MYNDTREEKKEELMDKRRIAKLIAGEVDNLGVGKSLGIDDTDAVSFVRAGRANSSKGRRVPHRGDKLGVGNSLGNEYVDKVTKTAAKKPSKKRELPKNAYLSDEFNTPHPVERWSYVRKLMRSALRGENINPILYQGENLLAGVHRDAANAILNRLGKGKRIPKQNLDDLSDEDLKDLGINPDDLRRAVEDGDYGRIDELWDRK